MSIRYGKHSAAARRIIALMGRRPRLAVRRPDYIHGGHGWSSSWTNKRYEAWLERERARIARLPHETAGQAKRCSTPFFCLKMGVFYRLVDGHGKAYGKRYQRGVDDFELGPVANARIVQRQEEDLHSQLSRMMKRAHRAAMKD